MIHAASNNTLVIVGIFTFGYLTFLLRKMVRGQIDLYDTMMLSTLALLPAVFTIFPQIADLIGLLFGVAFPFVVMFGFLFFVLFLLVHRLTVQMHRIETANLLLAQELSLLRLESEKMPPGPQSGG